MRWSDKESPKETFSSSAILWAVVGFVLGMGTAGAILLFLATR